MTIEADGQVTAYATPALAPVTYPHTAFIEQLAKDAETRVLTEDEAMVITEATMFEALVSDTIPELRQTIHGFRCVPGCAGRAPERCDCATTHSMIEKPCSCAEHPHLAETNAKVFLKVALSFALGMSNDVTRVMERKQLFVRIQEGIRDRKIL